MSDKKKYEAVNKYNKANTKTYCIRLNKNTDSDIIERLSGIKSINGYIKALIRYDMKKGGLV